MLRVSRVNGTGVLVIAGAFALLSAAGHEVLAAAMGLLIALSGAAELHGASLISRGRAEGVSWLVGSQLFLLFIILGYCGWRLAYPDLTELREVVTDDVKAQLAQVGWTLEQGLKSIYTFWYTTVAVCTVIYQGVMARYYAKRRGAVEVALGQDDLGLHG